MVRVSSRSKVRTTETLPRLPESASPAGWLGICSYATMGADWPTCCLCRGLRIGERLKWSMPLTVAVTQRSWMAAVAMVAETAGSKMDDRLLLGCPVFVYVEAHGLQVLSY